MHIETERKRDVYRMKQSNKVQAEAGRGLRGRRQGEEAAGLPEGRTSGSSSSK